MPPTVNSYPTTQLPYPPMDEPGLLEDLFFPKAPNYRRNPLRPPGVAGPWKPTPPDIRAMADALNRRSAPLAEPTQPQAGPAWQEPPDYTAELADIQPSMTTFNPTGPSVEAGVPAGVAGRLGVPRMRSRPGWQTEGLPPRPGPERFESDVLGPPGLSGKYLDTQDQIERLLGGGGGDLVEGEGFDPVQRRNALRLRALQDLLIGNASHARPRSMEELGRERGEAFRETFRPDQAGRPAIMSPTALGARPQQAIVTNPVWGRRTVVADDNQQVDAPNEFAARQALGLTNSRRPVTKDPITGKFIGGNAVVPIVMPEVAAPLRQQEGYADMVERNRQAVQTGGPTQGVVGTGTTEAEGAALRQAARIGANPARADYAQKLSDRQVQVRQAAEQRKMARDLRMRGPGPFMMQMLKNGGQGEEGTLSPQQLGAISMWNPQLAQTIGMNQAFNQEQRTRREEKSQAFQEKRDENWMALYPDQEKAVRAEHADWSPDKVSAEARRRTSALVPGATHARLPAMGFVPGGGPGLTGAVPGGAGSATFEHRKGEPLWEFVNRFPEGTSPEEIKRQALATGDYTPAQVRDFTRYFPTNWNPFAGDLDVRMKAVERLLGRSLTPTQRRATQLVQRFPLIGPMAGTFAEWLGPTMYPEVP